MQDVGHTSRYLTLDWPAPANVRAITTCRGLNTDEPLIGLAGFNLARHVQDRPDRVLHHRAQLQQDLNLERQPFWLNQTHSTQLLSFPVQAGEYDCDGSYTPANHWPCVLIPAAFLLVLFCYTYCN